jgi:hypothetical protein
VAFIGFLVLSVEAQTRRNRNRGRGGNRRRGGPNCHLKEVDKCLEKMEEIGKRDDASNIISTRAGIDELCETVEGSQLCIKNFFKKCGTPIQRELFDFVLEQFGESVKLFCGNEENKATFLKHSPCINQNVLTKKNYHMKCVNPIFVAIDKGQSIYNTTLQDSNLFDLEKTSAKGVSDTILDLTCCSYNRFEDCSQELVNKACGSDAQESLKDFMKKTFGVSINMICPRSMFDPKSEACTSVLPGPNEKAKGKLSDNPLGKYMLNYMNYIFNFKEDA